MPTRRELIEPLQRIGNACQGIGAVRIRERGGTKMERGRAGHGREASSGFDGAGLISRRTPGVHGVRRLLGTLASCAVRARGSKLISRGAWL